MKIKISSLLLFINTMVYGQMDSSWSQQPELYISGFLDVFYVYDFNNPVETKRQPFLYNHNRHNEFNLNLGFIKLGLEHPKYRANLAIQTGTYVSDNYAAEPDLLQNIFEANVGVSLNKKNNLWLDAGIFASHIGFESAVSMDNWTMTRSLLAENSPYFLSGAKLTYKPNDQWELAGLILNGWQRIQRLRGNSLPSFGTQIQYTPSESLTLNWSTFIGTDDPDPERRMRYFNNIYGQIQISGNLGLIAGFDIGAQQRMKSSKAYDKWFSPVLIAQYRVSKKWKTAIRAEYYQDRTEIIIPVSTPNGFKVTGLSLNIDYSPAQDFICRLEGRSLISQDNIFESNTSPTNTDFFVGTSLAIKFAEIIKK
ncbi:MAG: porin [Saprospiraceae bacterium]|nr:porin [Saprospiraceae bacterium]